MRLAATTCIARAFVNTENLHTSYISGASRTHNAGTAHMSPHSFLSHHLAAISAAIATADATSVMHAAAAMSFRLSMGLAP